MCFCSPGTNLVEHYACRGTSFILTGKLSRYCYFVNSTGAVSRYKLDRSQISVKVQNLIESTGAESGCRSSRLSWEQEQKQKP